MTNDVVNNYKIHNNNLSNFACKDCDAIYLKEINEDFRTPFFRDIDKIIYTLSYSRYVDKTQVYSFDKNDMISKRMIHIQLVSKIARTIGRGLNLNEDLIEAASLGHDLGHVPFGHFGERVLSKISEENGEGYFNHNVQSVRILNTLENDGKGINITLQVLDAILCHNGEELKQKYIPMKKDYDEFKREYEETYKTKTALNGITSMTLEGCVVRISDVVAYIGKDIEDAIRLGKINEKDLPKTVTSILGTKNSDIVNTIVCDILENSINQNYIKMSDEIFNALQELIKFNYENIYAKANEKQKLNNVEEMFKKLFNLYYDQIVNNLNSEEIFLTYLNNMSEDYLKSTTPARKAIDYIAGMTDNYFLKQYRKYFDV